MKALRHYLLASVLLWSAGSQATILTISDFRPDPTYSGSNLFIASPDQGSLSFTNPSPAIPENTAGGPSSASIGFSLSGLTVDGVGGHSLSFDLVATASHSLSVNGGGFKAFTVTGGPNVGISIDPARIDAGESITFAIDNIVFSGGSASFNGFASTATTVANLTGNGTAVIDLSNNQLYAGTTGTSTEYRLGGVDFSFELSAASASVPNPGPLALLALGLTALIRARHKT